jgi:hypothetical protein
MAANNAGGGGGGRQGGNNQMNEHVEFSVRGVQLLAGRACTEFYAVTQQRRTSGWTDFSHKQLSVCLSLFLSLTTGQSRRRLVLVGN